MDNDFEQYFTDCKKRLMEQVNEYCHQQVSRSRPGTTITFDEFYDHAEQDFKELYERAKRGKDIKELENILIFLDRQKLESREKEYKEEQGEDDFDTDSLIYYPTLFNETQRLINKLIGYRLTLKDNTPREIKTIKNWDVKTRWHLLEKTGFKELPFFKDLKKQESKKNLIANIMNCDTKTAERYFNSDFVVSKETKEEIANFIKELIKSDKKGT